MLKPLLVDIEGYEPYKVWENRNAHCKWYCFNNRIILSLIPSSPFGTFEVMDHSWDRILPNEILEKYPELAYDVIESLTLTDIQELFELCVCS